MVYSNIEQYLIITFGDGNKWKNNEAWGMYNINYFVQTSSSATEP